jgi:hypothetical protein
MKERADKLFEKEQYVEATPLYLHVLSLEPRNADLNFKYGACLLYNSHKKKEALRYLNYGVTDPNADPRAHYFRGRALHLDFQFEEAKKNYAQYLKKRGKPDERYDVERDMNMCDNGKKLLTTFTDIIVAEKKEIGSERFFDIYTDSRTIGGDILVNAKFQSKLDKKMGHVPVVHFPPNAKEIYYASYGNDLSTGKDIYVRRRLPNGQWGDPQLVPGGVNTNEDEDFPYMHPSGNFLYFSSKGHNSMGGYDVFMSRKDPNAFMFKSPENVDFAISSPDDDLFYVVDSLFQNAYFASARQSQDGKLHVYRVKVARVPIQEVIIMGDFISEVNPEDQTVKVSLIQHSNSKDLGKLSADASKGGKYSYVFPQGGKYDYVIDVEGSDVQYTFTVELPFMNELRPLKQTILHTTENGEEIVKVINKFDENVEGAEAVIAQVIRKKSELNVNVDQFDLDQIEKDKKKDEILASLGFKNMSMGEISDQLAELQETLEVNSQLVDRIESNMSSELIAKSERVQELEKIEKELLEQAEKTTDPIVKHRLITEAQQKNFEKEQLIAQVRGLEALNRDVAKELGSNSGETSELTSLKEEFNSLIEAGKEDEALSLLAENKTVLEQAKSSSPQGLVSNYTEQSVELRNKIADLKKDRNEYNGAIGDLESEIAILKRKREGAKKKDIERIDEQIASKEEELGLVSDGVKNTNKKLHDLQVALNVVEDQMASLQNAMSTDEVAAIDREAFEEAIEQVNEIENESPYDYEEELASLEEQNPEINGEVPEKNHVAIVQGEHELAEQRILADGSSTELEQMYELIENNESSINKVDERIEVVKEEMVENGTSEQREELKQLEAYKESLESKNQEYNTRAELLKEETPDVALSMDDVVKEIAPNYTEELASIENNSSLSPKEQLESRLDVQQSFEEQVSKELNIVNEQLEEDPGNSEMQARKELLEQIKQDVSNEIAETNTAISALPSDPVVENRTTEEVIAEVAPKYQDKIEAIENGGGTDLEKAKEIQEENENLLASVNKEQKSIEKKAKRSPEDEELQRQLEELNQLEETIQDDLAEGAQTINALENTSSIVDNGQEAVTEEQLITSLAPEYENDIREIESSNESTYKKILRRGTVELGLIESLVDERGAIEEKLTDEPDNEILQKRKEAVEKLIAEKEELLKELKAESLTVISEEDISTVIEDVAPSYQEELNNATTVEEMVEAEQQLQEKLQKAIEANESKLRTAYSVVAEMENATYQKLIEESKSRVDALDSNVDTNSKSDFIEEVRGTENTSNALEATYTSKEDLETQDEELAKYEAVLDDKIEKVEKEIKKDDSPELKDQLTWLEEERETVRKKRRMVQISMGELETEVIASTNDDERINELNKEEASIQNELNKEGLSSGDRKKLEKELGRVHEDKTERSNELIKKEISNSSEEGSEIASRLEAETDNTDSEVAKEAGEHFEASTEEVQRLVEEADQAKSEQERNYLLSEANKRQNELNDELQEVLHEEQINAVEEEHGISLASNQDLQKKRRGFIVEIGEITREIERLEDEIKTAKKKEVPALEKEREQLIQEKELLEARLAKVDEQLMEEEEVVAVIQQESKETPITFNEERKLAATEEYEAYQGLAEEALKVENEIRILDDQLKEERLTTQRLVAEKASPSDIEAQAMKVKGLEQEVNQLKLDLVQRKYEAEKALPANEEEAMKMQNLVARGIKPIKAAALATALIQLPTNGLAIDVNSTRPNNGTREIPVGVESPSGLVYRVQVGAFARPLRPDVFKEFNPVSGEVIEGTNITRYMAGFFNSSESVVEARAQIRELGYSDAFIVAYCDGKRITFGDARRREANGTCVPKGSNEIMVEVAEKTAEKLGIPVSREVQEVPELTYNQAPGAVEADPIETMKGLFFTVQVGVFNRPIKAEDVFDLPEIMTYRLPNGQIRYNTGKFDSPEEALPRQKEARRSGVNGAFITAYYKGERISIGNARRLLFQNGRSILQSEIEKGTPIEDIDTPDGVIRTDTVTTDVIDVPLEQWEHRVQIVTKKKFDEFPRDVLNRYNAEGVFYYDEKDKRVKSVIYKNADYLPRLWNFRDDIDTVYLPVGQLEDQKTEILEVVFTDSILPGDFMDWMLRLNYRRDMFKSKRGLEVRIFGVTEDKIEEIKERIRLFGVEPEVIIETEDELELKDN